MTVTARALGGATVRARVGVRLRVSVRVRATIGVTADAMTIGGVGVRIGRGLEPVLGQGSGLLLGLGLGQGLGLALEIR